MSIRRRPPRDPQPRLSDGVVTLRPPDPADVPAMVALEDDELRHRFGFPHASTEANSRAAVERWRAGWTSGRSVVMFAVTRAEPQPTAIGLLVGGVELRHQGDGVAQLSWWTFARERQRGYAGRAVRLLSRFAFEELDLARLEALVEPDNPASMGVARSAGFVEEGVLRAKQTIGRRRADLVLLARLATDPAPLIAAPARTVGEEGGVRV